MNKGKSTWKTNKLLKGRRNYYALGSLISKGIGYAKEHLDQIADASTFAAGIAYNALSSGRTRGTGAGKAFNALGNISDKLGFAGKIGGAGLKLVGGLANAAFGYGLNDGNISKVQGNIDIANNIQADANSFDTLAAKMGNMTTFTDFSDKYIGKNGWLNKGASRKANDLRNQMAIADARQNLTMQWNANDITKETMGDLQRNYAAFGGPIGNFDFGMPAIDYDFRDRYMRTKEQSSAGQNTEIPGLSDYAFGGELGSQNPIPFYYESPDMREIKRQELAVLNPTAALNPTYAFGGELNTQGLDFTNGLLYINNGKSHEANPYGGVLMGMDSEGTPNMVEEGETVFNDYVFSDRLKVPMAIRNKYKLGGIKSMSFADASKKLSKESEERPNDPISKRGLEAILMDLAMAQEEKRMKSSRVNYAANGGKINKFDNGGIRNYVRAKGAENMTRSQAWFKLVAPQLIAEAKKIAAMPDGAEKSKLRQAYKNKVNSLQQSYIKNGIYDSGVEWGGKAKNNLGKEHQENWEKAGLNNWGNAYSEIFSPDGSSDDVANTWVDNKTGDLTIQRHAGRASDFENLSEEDQKVFDELSQLNSDLGFNWGTGDKATDLYWLTENIDGTPGIPNIDVNIDQNLENPELETPVLNNVKPEYSPRELAELEKNKDELPTNLPTGLRYAPAIGSGLQMLTDALGLTNTPNYTEANMVENAANMNYNPVRYRPVGNKLIYRPQDIDYAVNNLNAQAGATRRAVANNAGMNQGRGIAGLLAADYNAQNAIGNALFAADAQNFARRAQVEEFNRATEQANSTGFLQADTANQNAGLQAGHRRLQGIQAAAQMRAAERNAVEAARAANISGFFTDLGNIGRENMAMNWRNQGLNRGIWHPGAETIVSKHGGKLKRRRGLTR